MLKDSRTCGYSASKFLKLWPSDHVLPELPGVTLLVSPEKTSDAFPAPLFASNTLSKYVPNWEAKISSFSCSFPSHIRALMLVYVMPW